MGNPVSVSKTIAGTATYTTKYTYDLSGKPSKVVFPGTSQYSSGYVLEYIYYPGSGLLKQVYGASDYHTYATYSFYEPTGKIGQMEYGNGTATIYTYDPQSARLTAILTEDPTGLPQNDLQRKTYQYSAAGDITMIEDQLTPATYSYIYDKLHRLVAETSTVAATTGLGNEGLINSYDGPGPLHAVKSVYSNGATYDYVYDANGNMATGYDFTDPLDVAIRTFTYNAENMPTKIEHSTYGVTDIIYDGEGGRAKKTVNNVSTYYIGEHFEVTENKVTRYIFAGGTRIAMVENDTEINYFHKDHLGSSSVLTDSSGTGTETTSYLPYGGMRSNWSVRSAAISNYKYTDQELDPETGLYNYNARLYDPVTGMFISADTIVPNFSDPQTLNRYMYARGNPLVYVDPSGHLFGIDDLLIGSFIASVVKGAAIGAAMGGTVSAVTGGDIGQGMLTGAISGAIFGGVGAYVHAAEGTVAGIESVTKVGLHTAAGAVSGGINSGITGGDVGIGMVTGGIAGGLGMAFGKQGQLTLGDYPSEIAKRSLIGGVSGGIASEMYGGSFGDGFKNGAKTAAIGGSANCFGVLLAIGAVKLGGAIVAWSGWQLASKAIGNPYTNKETAPALGYRVSDLGTDMIVAKTAGDFAALGAAGAAYAGGSAALNVAYKYPELTTLGSKAAWDAIGDGRPGVTKFVQKIWKGEPITAPSP